MDDLERLALDHFSRRTNTSPSHPRRCTGAVLEQILHGHIQCFVLSSCDVDDRREAGRSTHRPIAQTLVIEIARIDYCFHVSDVACGEHQDHGREDFARISALHGISVTPSKSSRSWRYGRLRLVLCRGRSWREDATPGDVNG